MISYGKQHIDNSDIEEVTKVLKGDFLTTGPTIAKFEKLFAEYVGSKYAVAVSNGTAALHIACIAAGLKKDDELLTSAMTFAASANCALYSGAKPVFVDIDNFGLLDPDDIKTKITDKSKIIIPVHYTGLTCDMEKISTISENENLTIIEDACHALGSTYSDDSAVGNCKYSDMTVFSFHPVKHITTGEGGMITTNSEELYNALMALRTHGIVSTNNELEPWSHTMKYLGFNYRLTDIQAALGISQIKKVTDFIKRRKEIAKKYNESFDGSKIEPLYDFTEKSAYHLFVIKCKNSDTRLKLYNFLKTKDIFCQVHYMPVYYHQVYKDLGYEKGTCEKAEKLYDRILSIPIYPDLTDEDQDLVIDSIYNFIKSNSN